MSTESGKPADAESGTNANGANAAGPADSNAENTGFSGAEINNFKMALITGFGLVLLVIFVMLASDNESVPEQVASSPEPETPAPVNDSVASAPATAAVSSVASGDVVGDGIIERRGEGRHFFTSIRIPPGAETLYLSGSGASRQADGSMGNMEQQVVDTFSRFQETLEAEGWSMSDIVQVRAFAVADEFGTLDFDGFNRGYRQFFGTEANPMKPVRTFVEIAGLVVPGWLVEIEIRAARMPE